MYEGLGTALSWQRAAANLVVGTKDAAVGSIQKIEVVPRLWPIFIVEACQLEHAVVSGVDPGACSCW